MSDPFDAVRWLFAHLQNVVWFIAIAAIWLRWISRRARGTPAGGLSDGRRALLDGLRLAATAAKSAQAAAQTGRFAAAASPGMPPGRQASLPGTSTARVPAPAPTSGAGSAAWPGSGPTAGDAAHGLPGRPPRSALLEAFRSPGGARSAVILAEILAPPVGLR